MSPHPETEHTALNDLSDSDVDDASETSRHVVTDGEEERKEEEEEEDGISLVPSGADQQRQPNKFGNAVNLVHPDSSGRSNLASDNAVLLHQSSPIESRMPNHHPNSRHHHQGQRWHLDSHSRYLPITLIVVLVVSLLSNLILLHQQLTISSELMQLSLNRLNRYNQVPIREPELQLECDSDKQSRVSTKARQFDWTNEQRGLFLIEKEVLARVAEEFQMIKFQIKQECHSEHARLNESSKRRLDKAEKEAAEALANEQAIALRRLQESREVHAQELEVMATAYKQELNFLRMALDGTFKAKRRVEVEKNETLMELEGHTKECKKAIQLITLAKKALTAVLGLVIFGAVAFFTITVFLCLLLPILPEVIMGLMIVAILANHECKEVK